MPNNDYNFLTLGDDFSHPEIILSFKITYFLPERPAPACSNPNSPAFSDTGEPAELEYELKGLLRFEPDGKDELGNPSGLLLELTPAQMVQIENHFGLHRQVESYAIKEYSEGCKRLLFDIFIDNMRDEG